MARFRSFKRVLYVVPVIGAVVFGAVQAFAAPAVQREALACSMGCLMECGGAGGVCSSYGYCVCY